MKFFGLEVGSWADWISGVGSLAAVVFVIVQLRRDKKRNKKEHVDNTFFNLLNIFKDIQAKVLSNSEGESDIQNMLNKLKCSKEDSILSEQLPEIDRLIMELEKSYCKQGEFIGDDPEYKSSKLEEIKKKNQIKSSFSNIKKYHQELNNLDVISEVTGINEFREAINPMDEKIKMASLSDTETREIVENVGNEYHLKLGTYFRTFYMIVSFIEKENKDIDIQKYYLKFARSILSSEELLAIFYNTFYYSRGEGSRDILDDSKHNKKNKLEFFSKNDDIEKFSKGNSRMLTYFSFDDFTFGETDFKKLTGDIK